MVFELTIKEIIDPMEISKRVMGKKFTMKPRRFKEIILTKDLKIRCLNLIPLRLKR